MKIIKIIKKTGSLNLTVLVALLLLIVCTSVLAYFTAADSSTNQWRVGYVDVIPKENYQPPDEIKPGITFTKEVGEEATPIQCSNDRIGFVIAQGATAEDAVAACEEAMKRIQIKID